MNAFLSGLLARPRRFWIDTTAALSVEAAIILPILCGMYVAGYQFFDGYRREAQIFKANYAVADLLSRRRQIVTPLDLEGLENVFETLIFSEDTSFMRFSEIRRTGDRVEVIWSYATDGQPAMSTTRLQGYLDQIPTLDDNERVLVVESYTYDDPFFSVGLEDRIIPSFTPISPRYEARVAFAPGEGVAPDNDSVLANDTDCGNDVVLINGVPIIGAGNCAGL